MLPIKTRKKPADGYNGVSFPYPSLMATGLTDPGEEQAEKKTRKTAVIEKGENLCFEEKGRQAGTAVFIDCYTQRYKQDTAQYLHQFSYGKKNGFFIHFLAFFPGAEHLLKSINMGGARKHDNIIARFDDGISPGDYHCVVSYNCTYNRSLSHFFPGGMQRHFSDGAVL